jgi:CBS domain-containing protein
MNGLPLARNVSDVMTTRVHTASPLTPFKVVMRLIVENRVSAIPIVDQQGVPVGVVSESDLLLKVGGRVASDVMTSPAITVALHTGVGEAARSMREKNVRRLVVVDQRGRIAGIVSRSDLLKALLESSEERSLSHRSGLSVPG